MQPNSNQMQSLLLPFVCPSSLHQNHVAIDFKYTFSKVPTLMSQHCASEALPLAGSGRPVLEEGDFGPPDMNDDAYFEHGGVAPAVARADPLDPLDHFIKELKDPDTITYLRT